MYNIQLHQVTFIASNNPLRTKDSFRGATARKLGIPILDIAYLNDCVNIGKLLNTKKYLILSDTEKLEIGKIGQFLKLYLNYLYDIFKTKRTVKLFPYFSLSFFSLCCY